MIEDGSLKSLVDDRYVGWDTEAAQAMLSKESSLDQIAERVEREGINPQPKSGRQEYCENLVNRFT